MKILILLSLAAISLAKHQNGRSSFQYPGQPSSGKSKSFSLSELAGLLRSGKQSDTESSEVELHNPNRRDVRNGHSPPHRFSGFPKELSDIVLSILSKSPLIKQADPALEKEESSSSESSGSDNEESVSSPSGQGNESAAAINQEESSSEVNVAPADKQEGSSSSEEAKAPEVNQEVPAEAVISSDNGSAQNTPEQEEDAEPSLQSFDLSKFIKFAANAKRKRGFHSKHKGRFHQPSPTKENVPVSRAIRGVEINFSALGLDTPRDQIQEPQGKAKGTRRGRKLIKK